MVKRELFQIIRCLGCEFSLFSFQVCVFTRHVIVYCQQIAFILKIVEE
jgi:hypothetical protein